MNTIDANARTLWNYLRMRQEPKPMDAILAFGSNALRVADRAADLFLQGYGNYLIVAGGNGKDSIFPKTEAEIFSERWRARGIPEYKILKESISSNTGENIMFVRQLLIEKKLNLTSFLLVQKPYMERRTYATFQKQWPEADCIITSPQLSFEDYVTDDASRDRLVHFLVGNVQRIKEYPARGFQIPQDIPNDVWGAYTELVKLGYTNYLLQDSVMSP